MNQLKTLEDSYFTEKKTRYVTEHKLLNAFFKQHVFRLPKIMQQLCKTKQPPNKWSYSTI